MPTATHKLIRSFALVSLAATAVVLGAAPSADASVDDPVPAFGKTCGRDAGVGEKLKPFKLSTVDGKSMTPSSFKGKVALVNFWGTWCEPCLEELPKFDKMMRKHSDDALLVAIATDESADDVKRFIKKKGIKAKVAVGGEGYAGKYDSDKFPFSFVVDKKGVIVASYNGYRPECSKQLERDIVSAAGK